MQNAKRKRNTENSIKEAFLDLKRKKILSEITVSEICSKAEISRPTFYQHYSNSAELLESILKDICKLCDKASSIHCAVDRGGTVGQRYPLCQMVRERREYEGIFMDESLTEKLIETLYNNNVAPDGEGLSRDIQRSRDKLFLFFLANGCLAVARKTRDLPEDDWHKVRQSLHQILSGMLTVADIP